MVSKRLINGFLLTSVYAIILNSCIPSTAQIISPYQNATQVFYTELGNGSKTFDDSLDLVDSALHNDFGNLALHSLRSQILLAKLQVNIYSDASAADLINEIIFLSRLFQSERNLQPANDSVSTKAQQSKLQPWLVPRLYTSMGRLLLIKAESIERHKGQSNNIGIGLWKLVYYRAAESFFYKAFTDASFPPGQESMQERRYATQGYIEAQWGIIDSLATHKDGIRALSKKSLAEVQRVLLGNEPIVTKDAWKRSESKVKAVLPMELLETFEAIDYKRLAEAYESMSASFDEEIPSICRGSLENIMEFAEKVNIQRQSELNRAVSLAINSVLELTFPAEERTSGELTNALQRLTILYTTSCPASANRLMLEPKF